jgi:hypothetical protein
MDCDSGSSLGSGSTTPRQPAASASAAKAASFQPPLGPAASTEVTSAPLARPRRRA